MEFDPTAFKSKLGELLRSREYGEALAFVEKFEKTNPDNFEVLSSKVSVLGLMGRHEDVVAAADRALAINPRDHWIHHQKGCGLYYSGKIKDSLECFESALDITPNFNRSAEKKLSVLAHTGRCKEAVKFFESTDLYDFDHSSSVNNIGLCYMEVGNHEKARYYFYRGRHMDPNEPMLSFNLMRMYYREKNWKYSAYHLAMFSYLWLKKKSAAFLKKIRKSEKVDLLDMKHEEYRFSGPGKLFVSDSQIRETMSILKLLRGANMMALCNDTFNWVAINMPYDAVSNSKEFKGDIDIIIARPKTFPPQDGEEKWYRGFQVKTVLVDKYGRISSSKKSEQKHKLVKKQLDVLRKFGCEQIFFLEIFVLERGYSAMNAFPHDEVAEEIEKKAQLLEDTGYGYVVMAEEPSLTHDDESGGMWHIPLNVIGAQMFETKEPFREMVAGIEDFMRDETAPRPPQGTRPMAVSYCSKCKRLTHVGMVGNYNYSCLYCNGSISNI